ncbi:MAG TPA: hypothetical protein PLJ21_04135, partial [Pseudobdellovibrionaceae bacterium]|nr:hypothetical protein [Pseudobdellovibrionaceae bacterium]
VVENPNTDKWLILAKRLTVLLNEEKQYALSLPWLVKIHEKENTSESLYRLQYAKFESGDFKGVVENKYILPKDENGLKVQKLISESYIRLAEVSINKDDFSNYEKNISSFLESNTDQEKTSAAKLDYLDRLLERKEIEKVYAELKKMNFDSRFNKTFGKTTLRLQSVLMKNMDWLKVESLYVDHGTSLLSPDQKNQYLFSIFAQNRNLSEVEFKMLLSLNPSERDYYLGLIVVTKPDLYIEIYKKSKFESNKEKSFLLLAHQIKQGKSEPDLDPNDELILQEIIPVRMKNKNPKSIAYLDKIVIPTPAFSPKKFENYLKDAIYRVRRSRKMIAEDLKNTNFQRQTLILEKASTVEKSLADSIVNSPVPPDLDEAMKSEYASKLSELSSEFTSQSSEYDKIRTNIEKEMTNKISQNARLMNLDLWPWPKNSKIEPVEKAIGSRGFILSFLILDQLRNNKEITTEEYFEAKSRMNLLVISNEFAVEYLFSELSQFDQTSLLKKWEQIGAETENVK